MIRIFKPAEGIDEWTAVSDRLEIHGFGPTPEAARLDVGRELLECHHWFRGDYLSGRMGEHLARVYEAQAHALDILDAVKRS